MKIIFLKVIIVMIFLTPLLTVEAKPILPTGAFWIENHWFKAKDSQVVAPDNWRSINHDNLLLSGSAIPNVNNMMWLKKNYGSQHPIFILDLRQETHLYINGLPISLFYKRDEINWGKTLQAITQEEQDWIDYFIKNGTVKIHQLGEPQFGLKVPLTAKLVEIQDIYSEQMAAYKAGLGYFRITVPDYHPPSPDQVDQFLAIIKQLPKNAWLHIHCAAGKGRTTTFMVMRDILENAQHFSLETILVRQAKLGGISLVSSSPSHITQPWKKPYHQARIAFIKLFYTYIHSNAYHQETFTHWLSKQPAFGDYQKILKTAAYSKGELQ